MLIHEGTLSYLTNIVAAATHANSWVRSSSNILLMPCPVIRFSYLYVTVQPVGYDHKNLFTLAVCRYCVLLQQKEKWEEQEGRGQKEKEELNQEIQKNRLLQQENLQLKTEVDRYYTMYTYPQLLHQIY